MNAAAPETRLDRLEARVDSLEGRMAAFDTAISIFRWLGPIAVGISGVIIGKLI